MWALFSCCGGQMCARTPTVSKCLFTGCKSAASKLKDLKVQENKSVLLYLYYSTASTASSWSYKVLHKQKEQQQYNVRQTIKLDTCIKPIPTSLTAKAAEGWHTRRRRCLINCVCDSTQRERLHQSMKQQQTPPDWHTEPKPCSMWSKQILSLWRGGQHDGERHSRCK